MARQMKDSGVEWIGDIPADWQMVKLKILFNEVKNGNELGLRNALKFSFGNIVTKPVHEKDDLSAYTVVKCDDVVVNGLNLEFDFITQRVGIVRQEGVITSAYISMRPTKYIVPQYGCYMLKAADGFKVLHSMGRGLRQILAYKELSTYLFVLPPLQDQKNIVAKLDIKCAEIDKVVEQTRATIEEYKKLKQAIITEAVTKGVRGPRPMKPSGVEWIGDIPEEWYTSKAGRFIASTQNGLTRRDLSESSGDIVLKLRNITPEGTIDYSAVTRVKLSDVEKTAYTLEKGDFLFVRVNGSKSLVGKSAIFDGCDEIVAYNDHIIRVRLETNYSRSYFKWFLLSTPGKTEIDMRTSTSAGQFTISGQELRNIRLCVPSEEEQQEISAYLDVKCAEIDRIIEKKEQLIEELGSYKKSLIYEYVTGKKEVKTNMELKVPYSN